MSQNLLYRHLKLQNKYLFWLIRKLYLMIRENTSFHSKHGLLLKKGGNESVCNKATFWGNEKDFY